MVPYRYATLATSLSLALFASAQSITLVAPGNVPEPGTSFLVQRGGHAAPAPGGQNVLFDYSATAPTSSLNYDWQLPADLPNGAQFPDAQFALTNGGPDTVFYKATASGLERIGDTQTISALGTDYHLITAYSNSVLDLQLPLTHEDVWTDLFTGSFLVAGEGTTGQRDGAIMGEADAWGRLVMPEGNDTVEVLRVRTRITESIPLSTDFGAISVSHVRNTHAFYPLWGKFPVMRVISDTLSITTPFPLTIPSAYTEWLDASAVGVPEHTAQALNMHLFPNPATEQVTLVFASGAPGTFDVQVIDARGAVVRHTRTTRRTVDLDLSQWEAGLYQVVLTHPNGQRSVRPLAVAH